MSLFPFIPQQDCTSTSQYSLGYVIMQFTFVLGTCHQQTNQQQPVFFKMRAPPLNVLFKFFYKKSLPRELSQQLLTKFASFLHIIYNMTIQQLQEAKNWTCWVQGLLCLATIFLHLEADQVLCVPITHSQFPLIAWGCELKLHHSIVSPLQAEPINRYKQCNDLKRTSNKNIVGTLLQQSPTTALMGFSKQVVASSTQQ